MASTSTTTTTSSSSSSQPPPPPRPPIRYPLPIPAPPTSFPPLLRHHDAVLNSDYKTAFSGASDVVARLLPWHVWQIPEDVIALARHRATSSDVKGKGKEKEADVVVVQRPPGKRRRVSTGVARIQKAGRSDEADFDAIEGLSYPADDELDGILTRYAALRQRHVQLRHRGLGGEPTTTTAQQDERVPPLPATPFSKEGHLQLLGLAYHQDRADLEAAANELNEARQKLVETYGPQWQQQLDSVAPHFEMPSLPPLHPRHAATARTTAGPSAVPASTPAPAPAPAPAPSPAPAASSPAPTKRQTSPSASRKSKAKQAATATPASPAGQPTPRPRPPPPPPSAQQQSPAPGSGSGSGSNAASPAPPQASSSASPSNFPRPRPAYGAAPGGSASTPASAAAAAAAAAEVAAPKARSASPAAPPQAAAAGGSAGATNPAPTPPLRIILPLNLISKLTSAGIAPVPAKHLQPAIDAHKRQTSGGGGGPVSYSTAPCEPDSKQREAAVLLGITEGPANGSSTQRHQLVHLSVLLSRLTPPQLNALAEAVNLVQQQSAPPAAGGGAAAPPGGQGGGGGGQQ